MIKKSSKVKSKKSKPKKKVILRKRKKLVPKKIDPKYKTPVKVEEKVEPVVEQKKIEEEITIDTSSLEPELIQCTFKGIIRKGSNFGNSVFAAVETPHQKHTRDFACHDVISMEKSHGRHIEGCIHVGYLASKVCCVKESNK